MKYEKLVRDKIPEILDKKHVPYTRRMASPGEYQRELIKKLSEEVKEFNAEHSLEELADVIEVIEAMKQLPSFEEVEIVRMKKREERGGFDDRIILKGEK